MATTKAEAASLKALAENRYWGEAEGRAALDALAASGLSMAAFSRTTGITARRLACWRGRGGGAERAGKIEFVGDRRNNPQCESDTGALRGLLML